MFKRSNVVSVEELFSLDRRQQHADAVTAAAAAVKKTLAAEKAAKALKKAEKLAKKAPKKADKAAKKVAKAAKKAEKISEKEILTSTLVEKVFLEHKDALVSLKSRVEAGDTSAFAEIFRLVGESISKSKNKPEDKTKAVSPAVIQEIVPETTRVVIEAVDDNGQRVTVADTAAAEPEIALPPSGEERTALLTAYTEAVVRKNKSRAQ